MNNLNNAVNSENHEFKIHPAIIFSLITAQASGVEKAILELVMNSVDAGATRIDVTLDQNGFVVADNGRGFADMQAIESCFGVFGLPHAAGDAFYGRFRLGRAQCFGYAKTEWHTKNYKMFVDLNLSHDSSEYGYKTTEVDEYYQGCKVTGQFYKYMGNCDPNITLDMNLSESPYNVQNAVLALALSVKYLPVTVYINNIRVNLLRDNLVPYKVKNNVSYYLTPHLNESHPTEKSVQVYNKGVYAYSIYSYLLSGDIVSDDAISLNMARNEAQKKCPVAKGIHRNLRDWSYELACKNTNSEDKKDKEPILDNAYYIQHFWDRVLGINGEKFSDFLEFKSVLKQRWFLLLADETISYLDVFKFFYSAVSYYDLQNTSTESIYFYSNDEFKKFNNLKGDIDGILPLNGYFPIEIFPSEDILANLHTFDFQFDFSQFEELKPFVDLNENSKITQKIDASLDLNQRRQALAVYVGKVLIWLSNASLYIEALGGEDLSGSLIYNQHGSWNLNNDRIKFGVTDYDKEHKTDKYKNYIFERVNYTLNDNLAILSKLDIAQPENVKVLTVNYCQTLTSRKIEMESFNLTPFENVVFQALNFAVRMVDNRFRGHWSSSAWKNEYYVKPENIARRLFLAEMEDRNVLACTDLYDYVLIDYEYFKRCVSENKFELLVYLIMHEVAHCTKKSSELHGEVFYQGFHTLLKEVGPVIFSVENDISNYVLNVANFKSKEQFVQLGMSKSNVAYFLRKQLKQYVGRY